MPDRRMLIIFLIVFINLLGFGIILPLLPYYVESLGAGAMAIGLLSATYSLFQLLSAPILGEISDKIGRRPVLIFSLVGTALSFFMLGAAKTLPWLFLSRIIDGASGGNISTAQAYIADITTKENRTQGMGVMMAAFSLGFILGPALGGLLSRYGYAVPAYVAAVVSVIATIVTYFFLPESAKLQKQKGLSILPARKSKLFFSFKDFYDALTHPSVGVVMTMTFLMMLGFSLMQGTFALFTEHTLHLSAEQNGYLFAYIGLVGIVIQMFFLKPILKLMPEHKAAIFGIAVMSVSLTLIALGGGVPMLIFSISLLAFANSVSGPVLSGLLSKLSPDDEQGNVMGVSQSVASLARLVGPLLGTVFYFKLGPKSPYLFAGIILALTAMIGMRYLKIPTFLDQAKHKIQSSFAH